MTYVLKQYGNWPGVVVIVEVETGRESCPMGRDIGECFLREWELEGELN